MPVRDGRWVSPAKIAAEKAAAKVAFEMESVGVTPVAEPAATRQRRSPTNAIAAIADATGAQVTLNDPEPEAVTVIEDDPDKPLTGLAKYNADRKAAKLGGSDAS